MTSLRRAAVRSIDCWMVAPRVAQRLRRVGLGAAGEGAQHQLVGVLVAEPASGSGDRLRRRREHDVGVGGIGEPPRPRLGRHVTMRSARPLIISTMTSVGSLPPRAATAVGGVVEAADPRRDGVLRGQRALARADQHAAPRLHLGTARSPRWPRSSRAGAGHRHRTSRANPSRQRPRPAGVLGIGPREVRDVTDVGRGSRCGGSGRR